MLARAPIGVSYIIPTMACTARAEVLERAIGSVAGQAGVTAVPIVVVNGPNPAPEVMAKLERDQRIVLERLPEADLPAAIRRGRALVDAQYFGSLDDDDFLLPGALKLRVDCLEAHPTADVVVTNGLRRHNGVDTVHWTNGEAIRADPLKALLDSNWFLPGCWLCRTDSRDLTIFDQMPRHLECTYLAVQFARRGRIRFIDAPTVVWVEAGGLSTSAGYLLGQSRALERIIELPLPANIRRGLVRHLAMAYHTAADFHRQRGELPEAWAAHLASFRHRTGLRFLPSTRHLVAAAVRRGVARSLPAF